MNAALREIDALPVYDTGMQEYYWSFNPENTESGIVCDISCADDEAEHIANSCLMDKKSLQHFLKEPFRHVARWMNYPWQWEQQANRYLQALVACVKERLAEEGGLTPACV